MKRVAARLFVTTAAVAALMAAAAPAQAQRVTRIVAFGDSYADDGNFFELTGIPRPAAYPNGRFSNGTNFIDTLGLLLGARIDNYAIGGAFTGSGNINGIPGLGFQLEYQSYLSGGGPAAFPRSNSAFGPQDLLAISIGGNDARAYRLGGGTVAGAAAAAAPKIVEATTGLTALVNAGARNITFLAGDVGRLPEAVGQPSAAAGTAFSAAFNTGMQATLAGFANQGVIVNYLDLNRIGDRVQANLAAFGLTSAGAATSADVAAGRADNFLFYADNVHLTSAGFAIVGRYAARQLEAPLQFEPQLEAVRGAATAFADGLESRLNLSPVHGDDTDGLRFFLTADYGQRRNEDTLTALGNRYERFGGTAGVEYAAGGLLVGAAASLSKGDTDFSSGSGRIDSDAMMLGAFARWSNGAAFIEGYGGIGRVDLDIRRAAVIDELSASPEADTMLAGGRIGYLFGFGSLRVGPTVGLSYSRAELDGYTETGDQVLALNVSAQEESELVGHAGLQLEGDFDIGGARAAPYLIARVEKELEDEARRVTYSLTAAPTIVNRWTLGGNGDEAYGRLAGGVNLALGRNISLQVSAATTIDREGGDDSSASIGARIGF